MSSRLVGLVLEHYPLGGSEFTLAIVLADEAQHSGGITASPIKELARLSRQSENNTRRLLQKMEESGWLICIERSKGGHARPSVYQINPDWVNLPLAFQFGQEPSNLGRDEPSKPPNLGRVEPYNNPPILGGFPRETGDVFKAPSSCLKALPPVIPQFELKPDTGNGGKAELDDGDLTTARWMFDRLRTLKADLREPSWHRWAREIRLLRSEVNALTHRRICEVFKWANDDRTPRPGSTFCWAKQILSPANLRKHWERLSLECSAAKPSAPPATDPLCQVCHVRQWNIQQGKAGKRLCRQCAAEAEAMA